MISSENDNAMVFLVYLKVNFNKVNAGNYLLPEHPRAMHPYAAFQEHK